MSGWNQPNFLTEVGVYHTSRMLRKEGTDHKIICLFVDLSGTCMPSFFTNQPRY